MKRFLLSTFFLCVSVSYAMAQYDGNDRDAINEDRHNATAAANAARKSLWSLGANPSEWARPVYGSNGWDAKVYNTHVNINYRPPTPTPKTKPSGSTGKDIFQKNMDSKRKQNDRASKGLQRINAARAAARRKAEEERRRREAENRRDYAQGYQNHKMQTAGFYQTKAAEDAWLHSEGVRQLENLDVTVLANVPSSDSGPAPIETTSEEELAEMLEQNNGEVRIILIEAPNEERKSQVSLTDMDNPYSLIDDGRAFDEDEWTWEETILGETMIPETSSKRCFKVEEEVLIEGKTIDLDSFCISTLPHSGCVIYFDDSVMFVDDNDMTDGLQALPTEITQMVLCGQRIIGKSHNEIVEIIGNTAKPLYIFETEQFEITAESDSTLILLSNSLMVSVVARINVNRNTLDEIARTGYNVRRVLPTGADILALVDNCILRLNDGLSLLYCNDEETINDVCLCKEGLLIASESNVTLLRSDASSCQFLSTEVKRLWFDMENVYAQNNNKDLVKYNIK